VAAANAGKHLPERVENAIHRFFYRSEIVIVDVRPQHFVLGRGMFAIRFKVDAEVLVMFRIGETVVFFQSIDL
jgi:hypothetical protein